MDIKFIGCFLLENSHLFIGVVDSKLVLNGLGIIVDFNGTIFIGDFNEGKM